MKEKDKIYGIGGTILFHAVILALLFFFGFSRVIPDEQGGIWVQAGNVAEAGGFFKAEQMPAPVETPPEPQTTPEPEAEEEMIVQDDEETVALNAKKAEEERQREENRRREEERKRKEEEERKRREEQAARAANLAAGAFGNRPEDGNAGTHESGSGQEGSLTGNASEGAAEGVGGEGSYDLSGRSIGPEGLPKPSYQVQEEGRIVVNIVVNASGYVISAEIGRGTTIDNPQLRRSALNAARKAVFNAIDGKNNQAGTITYRYKLK